MTGLSQVYRVFGYEKALELNIRFADWLYTIVKDLPDDKIQEMLHCEHGGINESLAELYAYTGNELYLDLSRIFQHRAIIDPITEGEDILSGKHANTQIPKFVGSAFCSPTCHTVHVHTTTCAFRHRKSPDREIEPFQTCVYAGSLSFQK